jgi:hypothetical protein
VAAKYGLFVVVVVRDVDLVVGYGQHPIADGLCGPCPMVSVLLVFKQRQEGLSIKIRRVGAI